MRRLLALALFLQVGCVSGGGDTTPGPGRNDAASETATDAVTDSSPIFPTEDGSADDTAPSSDTAPPSDTAPTCGVPGMTCCPGSACSVGYCFAGTCYDKPTGVEEGSDPGMCSDLGVTHVKPAFFARFTVRGRPGALAHRMYKKVSCPGATTAEAPGSPFSLGPTGMYSETLENTATSDCANGNLGRYEVWFVVDGQETTHHVTSVFNSACVLYATCGTVTSACP